VLHHNLFLTSILQLELSASIILTDGSDKNYYVLLRLWNRSDVQKTWEYNTKS